MDSEGNPFSLVTFPRNLRDLQDAGPRVGPSQEAEAGRVRSEDFLEQVGENFPANTSRSVFLYRTKLTVQIPTRFMISDARMIPNTFIPLFACLHLHL